MSALQCNSSSNTHPCEWQSTLVSLVTAFARDGSSKVIQHPLKNVTWLSGCKSLLSHW